MKGIEKNAQNMYLTRCHLVREDISLVPLISPRLPTPALKMSNPYICPPQFGMPLPGNEFPTTLLAAGMNSKFIPYSINAGISEAVTSSPIESPLPQPSTSPVPYRQANSSPRPTATGSTAVGPYEAVASPKPLSTDMQPRSSLPVSMANEKLVGDDLVRTHSVDSLFKRDVSAGDGDGK